MNLILALSLAASFLFALLSLFLFRRDQTQKKILQEREERQKHRLFEIEILKEIQDRIGYQLDVERVTEVIMGSLRNIFSYSTVSTVLIKENKLVFKTYIEEQVSRAFVEQVKKTMTASLEALVNARLPQQQEEEVTGVLLNNELPSTVSSFFNIPLIIGEEIAGLLNISSVKTGLYKEEEMTILYQIVYQASSAISKLKSVLTTEKGKLTAMISSLNNGVFLVDANSRLLLINNAAKEILQITEKEPSIMHVIAGLGGKYGLDEGIALLSKGQEVPNKTIQLDGKTIEVTMTPAYESVGKQIVGISVILHDITLEKNLEQIKEDFTNTLVHEMRAPLTAIKSATELILGSTNLSEEERLRFLHLIEDQSKKLLSQVGALLDAAKIESGRFLVNKTPSDLSQILADQVNLFLPQAQKKQIHLHSIIPPLPKIALDGLRMSQVINNLISNSLKFTPEEGTITVSAALETNAVLVSVSDTGIGIPKEKQDKLFTKFYQIVSSDSDQHLPHAAGTGLGLYITKGIVDAHGGTINVHSQEGKGTTISFSIPLLQKVSTLSNQAFTLPPTPPKWSPTVNVVPPNTPLSSR